MLLTENGMNLRASGESRRIHGADFELPLCRHGNLWWITPSHYDLGPAGTIDHYIAPLTTKHDKGDRDYWEVEFDELVRHHTVGRHYLFNPATTSGLRAGQRRDVQSPISQAAVPLHPMVAGRAATARRACARAAAP